MNPRIQQTTIASIVAISLATVTRAAEPKPILRIDPLLLAQAGEVWTVIAQRENPIWPGWNAADTPLLFYLPDLQDVLINHPSPPEGFRRYEGPIATPGFNVFVRDGKTFFEFDGQNTVTDVAGVPTLVVADTLSNRRSTIRGWLLDPRPADVKSNELSWEQLQGNPYDSMAMIAHEAFHAHQRRLAPNKGGNELALTRYPALSPANNVGFALEGELLAAALNSKTAEELRSHAISWLAVRLDRRARIGDEAADYEDRLEFLEGLAKYVEWRLFEVLERRTPNNSMAWVQGFQGYSDLKAQRDRLISQMVKMLAGDANVNNDPYGASPVRMRLYFSGMGVAALLDRLNLDWKAKALEPAETLTNLARNALNPTAEHLKTALEAVRARPNYADLQARKIQLERTGSIATRQIVDEIESGGKTALVVDYSELESQRPALAFTPFGILRVDENRTIYRLIPISMKVGETRFRQSALTPLLHNRDKKQFTCQLQSVLKDEDTARMFGDKLGKADPIELKQLELPGVQLTGGRARVSLKDRTVTVKLCK